MKFFKCFICTNRKTPNVITSDDQHLEGFGKPLDGDVTIDRTSDGGSHHNAVKEELENDMVSSSLERSTRQETSLMQQQQQQQQQQQNSDDFPSDVFDDVNIESVQNLKENTKECREEEQVNDNSEDLSAGTSLTSFPTSFPTTFPTPSDKNKETRGLPDTNGGEYGGDGSFSRMSWITEDALSSEYSSVGYTLSIAQSRATTVSAATTTDGEMSSSRASNDKKKKRKKKRTVNSEMLFETEFDEAPPAVPNEINCEMDDILNSPPATAAFAVATFYPQLKSNRKSTTIELSQSLDKALQSPVPSFEHIPGSDLSASLLEESYDDGTAETPSFNDNNLSLENSNNSQDYSLYQDSSRTDSDQSYLESIMPLTYNPTVTIIENSMSILTNDTSIKRLPSNSFAPTRDKAARDDPSIHSKPPYKGGILTTSSTLSSLSRNTPAIRRRVQLSIPEGEDDVEVTPIFQSESVDLSCADSSSLATVTEVSRPSSSMSQDSCSYLMNSDVTLEESERCDHESPNNSLLKEEKSSTTSTKHPKPINNNNNNNTLIIGTRYDGWEAFGDDSLTKFNMRRQQPFYILGTCANDKSAQPHVLSPPLMECLQGFFPFVISQDNFWLKYSLVRDGASLQTLLSKVRGCVFTILAVETSKGEVFGSLTGSPWKISPNYYGSGESFLWKLKNSRIVSSAHRSIKEAGRVDSDLEIYPYTRYNSYVQHCTHESLIVGGGEWDKGDCPYTDETNGVGLYLEEDLTRGSSASCATFANRALCPSARDGGYFEIMNVEVWSMTPCMTLAEAERLESRKLFIEEN